MLNCFKKFCVVVLFLSFMPSANAMITKFLPETFLGYSCAKQNSLDRELWKALDPRLLCTMQDCNRKQIEECLNKGANPNAIGEKTRDNDIIPLIRVISTMGDTDLLKLFIQRGADVNLKSPLGVTPLGFSISTPSSGFIKYYNQCEIIKILCDSGASLVNLRDSDSEANAFHYAAMNGNVEKIKALIMHGRFNVEKAIINQDQQKKLTTAVLALKKWSGGYPEGNIVLPGEIQDQIISYLPLEYFQDPDGELNNELYDRLWKRGYKHPLVFAYVNKRVAGIKQLLWSSSAKGTPVDLISRFGSISDQVKKQLEPILDGSEIDEHYRKFVEEFPSILEKDPKNLITIMYGNCARLEIKK